jgi:hypothetical protein
LFFILCELRVLCGEPLAVFYPKKGPASSDFWSSLVAKGASYTDMQMAAKQPGQKGHSLQFFSFFWKSAKKLRKNCNKKEWLWTLCYKGRMPKRAAIRAVFQWTRMGRYWYNTPYIVLKGQENEEGHRNSNYFCAGLKRFWRDTFSSRPVHNNSVGNQRVSNR